MDNREIQLYAWIMDERRERLLRELQQESLLNEGPTPDQGQRRRLLFSLAVTVIIVTVAILAGAQFLA